MGGNKGTTIAGAGGAAGVPVTTPPSTGVGTTYTNTNFGVVVADSAFNQARVLFTDNNNFPQTTQQIDKGIS